MKLASTVLFALACAGMSASALAAEKKELTPQQQRMSECNKQAEGKKGDERKTFMSTCLKGESAKPMTQQEKMKACNTEAAGKKGDERKAFMSTCLKGDGAAAAQH
jgi:hypothetical protein